MRRQISWAGLLLITATLIAQEYRATLLGVISDSSGAGVPSAGLKLVNLETGVSFDSTSRDNGGYLFPLVLPGRYRLEVRKDGFRALERSPIELKVNDRVQIDATLELGQLESKVTVTAETPLLETASSSRGQVIEHRKVTELPLNGRNPFTLMNLAAGVQYTGSLLFSRPFDNGAIAQFSINGGRNGVNEYQIDGVPNNAHTGIQDIGYVPPAEATQEFKIQTNTYDAQYGRTGGGIVSVSIKPGTNQWHGAAYEYLRRKQLESNQFAANAAGRPRSERVVDQYGFVLDGPLTIPRVYRGKHRTFFMFAMEKYRERLPISIVGTVPTSAERGGDFSRTFAAGGRLATIYDPFSARLNPAYAPERPISAANPQYIRTPFSGNVIPANRLDRVGAEIAKDYPEPNQAGDPATNTNNLLAVEPEVIPFLNLISRVDHNLNSRWRVYGRWNYNNRPAVIRNIYNIQTRAKPGGAAVRRNDGGVFDAVGNLTPATVLTARVGFNRFSRFVTNESVNLASLGFPPGYISQLQTPDRYPIVNSDRYIPLGLNQDDRRFTTTYTAQSNLMRVSGNHVWRAGFEYRLIRYGFEGKQLTFGQYLFDRNWTGVAPQVADPNSGNGLASMLLGTMASGTARLSNTQFTSWHYPVLFLQDDWRIRRNLTVNLGLRWDYEAPAIERYNRQNRGFDQQARSPIQVPGFDLRGGLLFAGVNGLPRGAFDPDRDNFQPRAGAAWKIFDRVPLVFRGGAGLYYLPTIDDGGSRGFSQDTTAITATPDFRPSSLISNPFPDTLIPRVGSSIGLATQLGEAVAYNDPRRTVPRVWQFSAGFEYEVIPGLLAEASYVGSRTRQLQTSRSITALPVSELERGSAYLNTVVPNPFFGVLPRNTPRGAQATTQRRSLLAPFPQFASVTAGTLNLGSTWYNSAQFRVQQRFKSGLSYLVSYTVSKTMEAISFLNAQDPAPARGLTSFDVPQRLVVSGIYEFPLGRGKRFASSGPASHLVGNWQVSWVGTIQSGPPMPYPGGFDLRGAPKLSSGQSFSRWFDTSRSIWVQTPPDTLRTTPFFSPNIRRHAAPLFDLTLTREFRIREGHRVQVRVSGYNATNTPVFGFPNTNPTSADFGVVALSQINNPRSIEVGFRYVF
jgi:hypothetical protein